MQRKISNVSTHEVRRRERNGQGDCFEEMSFTAIRHLAWLNWKKDGSPEEMDMEYLWAAESLRISKPGQ